MEALSEESTAQASAYVQAIIDRLSDKEDPVKKPLPYPFAGKKKNEVTIPADQQHLYKEVDGYYLVHYPAPGKEDYPIDKFAEEMATRFFMAAETNININYSPQQLHQMIQDKEVLDQYLESRNIDAGTVPEYRALMIALVGGIVNRTVEIASHIQKYKAAVADDGGEYDADALSSTDNANIPPLQELHDYIPILMSSSQFVVRRSGSRDRDDEFGEMLGEVARTIMGVVQNNDQVIKDIYTNREKKIAKGMLGIDSVAGDMRKAANKLTGSQFEAIRNETLSAIDEFENAAKRRITVRVMDSDNFKVVNAEYVTALDRFKTLQEDLNQYVSIGGYKISARDDKKSVMEIADAIHKGTRLIDDLARIRGDRDQTRGKYHNLVETLPSVGRAQRFTYNGGHVEGITR